MTDQEATASLTGGNWLQNMRQRKREIEVRRDTIGEPVVEIEES